MPSSRAWSACPMALSSSRPWSPRPAPRWPTTSLSASSIRQQFSTPVNVSMSQYGFAFLRHASEALAVGGEPANVTLIDRPYLFLANAGGLETMRETHAVQREAGADVALLT